MKLFVYLITLTAFHASVRRRSRIGPTEASPRCHHTRRIARAHQSSPRMNLKAAPRAQKAKSFPSNTSATNSRSSDLSPGNPDGSLHSGGSARRHPERRRVVIRRWRKDNDAEIIRTITSLRPRDCRTKSKSRIPMSFLSATASSRRNTAGTITKVSMCAAKRS